MYLRPDLSTFRVFPWASPTGEKVARIICDIYTPDGTPFVGCPRTTLKRVIAMAAAKGYSMKAGPEAEFFLFQTKNGIPTTESHDAASYFDLSPVDMGEDVRREIVLALEAMGFHVEAAHHEVAPGPARDRFPLRRCADDRRQRDDVQVRREERGDPERAARHLHAQADLRHQRLGHAHAHVALLGRHEHLLRREGAGAAERDVPELHRRHPAPRERLLRDHQPARQFVQAAGARLRSADQHRLVREEPQPARPRAGARAARRRASSCGCPIRRATRISRSP